MLYKLVPYRHRKWLAVFGCFLIHLSLGVYYTFGNIQPYMTSYLREYVGEDIRYAQTIWITTFGEVFLSMSSIIAGILCHRYQINILIVIYTGCFLMSLGVALTYFTIQYSFYAVIASFAGLLGFGLGFAYLGPLSVAMKWFPKNKGLANATVLLGFGATASVMSEVQTQYINPDDYSPDKPYSADFPDEKYYSKENCIDLLERVPKCYLLMSAIFLGLQFIAVLLVSEPDSSIESNDPERSGLINDDNDICESSEETNSLGVKYQKSDEGMDYQQALRHPVFYLLMGILTLSGTAPSNITSFYKTFGLTFIDDDKYLTLVGSIASLFNSFGRLFWGFAIDKLSCKMTLLIIQTALIALCSTIYLTKFIVIQEVYAASVCLVFFANCGLSAVFPTIVARTFGQKNFTTIFGFSMLSFLAGSFVSSLITNYKDYMGWFWFFIVGCGVNVISWLANFVFSVTDSKGNDI